MKTNLFILLFALFGCTAWNAEAQTPLFEINGQSYEVTEQGMIQNTQNTMGWMDTPPYGFGRDANFIFRASMNERFREIFSRERVAELTGRRMIIYFIVLVETKRIVEIFLGALTNPYPLTAEETWRIEQAMVGFQLDWNTDDYPEDASPYVQLSIPLFFHLLYR